MKYLLLVVCILLSVSLCAQLPSDTHPQQGLRPGDVTTRQAEEMMQHCEELRFTDLDSLVLVARQLYEFGKKHQQVAWQSQAEAYQGFYYYNTGKPDSSLLLADKNIPLITALKSEITLLTKWYSLKGLSLMKMNRQREALEQFYAALRLSETNNDKMAMCRATNNIGWAFMELNQFETAITNFNSALQIMQQNNLPDRFGGIYNNLASCHGSLGHYDSAYKYAQKGITIAHQFGDYEAEANGLNIMGTFLAKENRYREALNYFLQAKPLREKIGDPFFIVSDLAEIADLQSKVGDTAEGIKNCKLALDIAAKNKLDAKLPLIYVALAHNYEASGNYKEAANTWKKVNELKDKLYADANPQALAEIQAKYESTKKQQQILVQQAELTRKNFLLTGTIITMILLVLLAWSWYHRKQLKQESQLQAEIMRQQQLSARAVLEAEEKERQRIAKDLHDGIGQMMSAAKMNLSAIETELPFHNGEQKNKFEKIIGLVDESCKEVRSVSHNMMPNVLLKAGLGAAVGEFIDKIDNSVLKIELHNDGLAERLNSDMETILYRVIQECVNNVIKHAAASWLHISLIRDKDGISATIEDNGIGFDTTKLGQKEGLGLRNIRTRIEYLKGTVDFDSRPGNGTLIAIHVPLAA